MHMSWSMSYISQTFEIKSCMMTTLHVRSVSALTIQHFIAFFFHAVTMEVLIYTLYLYNVKQHNLEAFALREHLSLMIKTLTHLETVKCVCFWEHLELRQFPDKSDCFVFCLNVDLVFLPNLKTQTLDYNIIHNAEVCRCCEHNTHRKMFKNGTV